MTGYVIKREEYLERAPQQESESQARLHPAEAKLISELRRRRHGRVIVSIQDGVPQTVTPIGGEVVKLNQG